MRFLYVPLEFTTASDGSATVTAAIRAPGNLYSVEWVDGDLADGVDATLKCINRPSGVEITLLTLSNANDDAIYYPRYAAHTNAGAALDPEVEPGGRVMGIVESTLQLAVTNGGDTKSGKMFVYYQVD